MRHPRYSQAFTLIELLIVVAIIAVLASIAVPNFLEAQVRAKVARARSDMRTMAVGIEAFRVDLNNYPEGTDNPALYPEQMESFFEPLGLAKGYYAFRSRGDGKVAGRDFPTLTTPVAYVSTLPTDPFAGHAAGFLSYCYRNAKDTRTGWILTSVGPDTDLLESQGRAGVGSSSSNPLSTNRDSNTPARLGDVNERDVIHYIEGSKPAVNVEVDSRFGSLAIALEDLSYDPTNGTVSDGDLIMLSRTGMVGR
jgi:prepilin-type N-terminal cleavage/methylation domain-containing protein